MKLSGNIRSHAGLALGCWLLGLTLIGGGAGTALGQTASAAPGTENPNDWPQYHRTSNAWRYSPLDQINKANVKNLRVAWIHQPGDITMGLQATPIVVDGVMYYIGPNNNVFALDAATGEQLWHYQPQIDPLAYESFYASASRGVTVGQGRVFIGTMDGRFVAVDQGSGKEVWSTRLVDQAKCSGCLFSSPPVLAGNVLVGGTTGGDQPQRGKIFAVNATTGEPAWTFDTIKEGEQSWPGDTGDVGGGGAWLPGTYDAATDTIFIGTSNAAPDFYGDGRKGDNLYTASLLALDAKTGKLKWHRQEIPHDTWDYDSAYEALVVENGGRELIVHLNKSGFVFVMEKANGALVNVWPLSETYNFVKTIDPKSGELIDRRPLEFGKENIVCPYLLGTRSWNHGAFNPKTGLWYTNAMEVCEIAVPGKQDPSKLGIAGLYLGVDKLEAVPPPGRKASARLDARDPVTGERKWTVDYPLPGLGSVLTTGGGLVFNGDPEGIVRAYDADDGSVLWQFRVGSGIRSGLISYAVKGKQYVAVPSGWGSLAPGFMASVFPRVKELQGGATMVVFALD